MKPKLSKPRAPPRLEFAREPRRNHVLPRAAQLKRILVPTDFSPKRGRSRPIDSILVLIDFSPASRKGLQFAAELAHQFGASLTLLHVVEPHVCIADFGYGPVCRADPDRPLLKNSRSRLQAAARRLARELPVPSTAVRTGPVATAILEEARQIHADLIVMAPGIHAHETQLRDNQVLEVVRHAPCPVLVIAQGYNRKDPA